MSDSLPSPTDPSLHGVEDGDAWKGEQRHAEFLRCYTQNYHRIFGFILTLLPNTADAEEVLQETSIVLWNKFDTFEQGTDFVRWACAVAQRMTLKYRRERKKGPLLLGEEMLQEIASVRLESSDLLEQRRGILAGCMKKLSDPDRKLIQQQYAEKMTSRKLAVRLGRPENTVYKALSRIRRQLMECVDRVIRVEGQA